MTACCCRASSPRDRRNARSAAFPCAATASDGPATLMLRPEQLVATAVSDDGSAGIATVLASEFRGHDVLLTVDPGGDTAPIVVRQHSVDPPQVDSKVRLDVMGAAVVLAENPPADGDRRTRRTPGVTRRPGGRHHRRPADHLPRTRRRRRRIRRRPRHAAPARTHRHPQRPRHPGGYLGALAGGHVALPLPAGSDHTTVLDTYDPDVVVRAGAIAASPRPLARPASRPRAAAVHLGQHRVTQAGASVADEPDQQRRVDRPISRHHGNRPCRNHIADVVLLRTLGGAQPPAARRRAHPDRPSVVDAGVLGVVPASPRHHVRRRSTHLRPARPHRLRNDVAPPSALRHAGGRPARPGPGAPLRRTGRASGLATVRHVRRHRGHLPNGLSASRTRLRQSDLHRQARPRWIIRHRTARRRARRAWANSSTAEPT